MIDLYAMGSPNVVKIYVALEEMGLPYTVHPVDVFAEGQFSPEFLKLNPNAKVPVIVDSEGPGGTYTVFESGAILQYLADKTGKFLAKDGAARYDALQWMMVQMTTIGPMWGQYVHFWRFAPPQGSDYSLDRYRTQVRKTLDVVEGRLGEAAYLGGVQYSIADIATFPWLRATGMFLGKDV